MSSVYAKLAWQGIEIFTGLYGFNITKNLKFYVTVHQTIIVYMKGLTIITNHGTPPASPVLAACLSLLSCSHSLIGIQSEL